MRLQEAKHDLYRRLAKDQGYRSRAAFKLMEINHSFHIINRGMLVVDLGCAPGGWLQVARRFVGGQGMVLGVDKRIVIPMPNVEVIEGSVDDNSLAQKILSTTGAKVNLVLSDLAPNITGIWQLDHTKQIALTENAISVMDTILAKNGNAVFKVFEGAMLNDVRDFLKVKFNKVRLYKPKASKKASSEIYLVCLGYNLSEQI